jgi:CRP-like cAMP-binding protein
MHEASFPTPSSGQTVHGSPAQPSAAAVESSPAVQAIQALFADASLEARRITATSGTVLHEPTTAARHVHLIHRGQVRLYQIGTNGSIRLCEILGPNEWFGVGALAGSETYGLRAVAVGPTVVSEVRVERYLAALTRRPEMLIDLNRQLAAKVQAAREDAAELIFRDTNTRLVNTLLRFSTSAASTPREDGVVLNITHSQLAQAVGAARETISLALTQLRLRNLVKTGRNQLFFNPESLKDLRRQLETRPAEMESAA